MVPLVPTKTHTQSPNAEPLFWLVAPKRSVSQPKLCWPDWLRPEPCLGRMGRKHLNRPPAPRKAFSPLR